jgi:tRNA-specific 2-thiouridylase
VAGKDRARNALIVVQGHDDGRLHRLEVDAQEMHWIAGAPPATAALARLGAKTRYRMPDAACRIELTGGNGCHATFEAPQWAPTPGQYLVLYDGDVCLGGGVISGSADHAAALRLAS